MCHRELYKNRISSVAQHLRIQNGRGEQYTRQADQLKMIQQNLLNKMGPNWQKIRHTKGLSNELFFADSLGAFFVGMISEQGRRFHLARLPKQLQQHLLQAWNLVSYSSHQKQPRRSNDTVPLNLWFIYHQDGKERSCEEILDKAAKESARSSRYLFLSVTDPDPNCLVRIPTFFRGSGTAASPRCCYQQTTCRALQNNFLSDIKNK